MEMRWGLRSALALVACAASLAGARDRWGWEDYTVGNLAGQTDPTTGLRWGYKGTETGNIVVVNGISSPLGGGDQCILYSFNAIDPTSARIGLDLSSPLAGGWVRLEFDVNNGLRLDGNNIFRVQFNNVSIPDGGPSPSANQVYQPYIQNGGGGQAAVNGFFSNDGLNYVGNSVIVPYGCFAEPFLVEQMWYRVKMYFDFSDPTYPGRLAYAELFDINGGVEVKIGERRSTQLPVLLPNGGLDGALQLASMQLRFTGGPTQDWWIDNLAIESIADFEEPPDPAADPPPSARPELRPDVDVTVQREFYTDTVFTGEMPSICLLGTDLWLLDSNNGLTRWDMLTQPDKASFVDAAGDIEFDTQATGVMRPSADGTKLYIWAENFLSSGGGGGWRDVTSYRPSNAAWLLEADGDLLGGATGNHGAAVVTVNGQERLYAAWLGSDRYTGLVPKGDFIGERAPDIAGVGNRWAGALAEGFADRATGDSLFLLAQTDAAGNRVSDNNQQYQAIYTADWDSCDLPLARRVSRSAQILPWMMDCGDGPCVNRHSMQYVPATNTIWVLRAGFAPGTSQIGVYDIDTDTWRLVNMSLPDRGGAFLIENADLQLVGDRVFVFAQFYDAVYSLDATIDGCLADLAAPYGVLNVFDFLAFQTGFGNGDPVADLAPPFGVLNVFDFLAYQTAFGNGC